MPLLNGIAGLHTAIFGLIERALDGWFLGLFARLVFASVLFFYFFNSALTKIGEGVLGFLTVADSAYFQIVPPVVEAAGYDTTQVPFFPWGLVVYLGTYAEFILPVLLVLGLFTRYMAVGMIIFVAVQTYVDIAFHGVDTQTVGMVFDRVQDSAIADQRLLWLVPLIYLVVRGPGMISLDYLFGRRMSYVD